MLHEPPYFNLEVSPYKTALVLNGNRTGIQLFLKKYGDLSCPPQTISFEEWTRPQRIWRSHDIKDNKNALATDLSPYQGDPYSETNISCSTLDIQFFPAYTQELVLAVGYREAPLTPQLIVNQAGWEKFLAIVHHLCHERYWFYVTYPNDSSRKDLPFLLTRPFPGDLLDYELKAIECIRLEPDEKFFLNGYGTVQACEGKIPGTRWVNMSIGGNSAGLLLLTQWIRTFAASDKESEDILYPWSDIYQSVLFGEINPRATEPPQWFYLRKIAQEHPVRILQMGLKTEDIDCCILGNRQGLSELADLLERWAFRYGHTGFCSIPFFGSIPVKPGDYLPPGELCRDISPPDGICLATGWDLYGGASYNIAYDERAKARLRPELKARTEREIDEQFINDRICTQHTT